MRWRSALKRDVVDTSTAETLGRVTMLILDPEARKISGIVVGGMDSPVIAFEDLSGFGADAVTVDGTSAFREADDREARAVKGELDPIGKEIITENGTELGSVADIEFDAADGSVRKLVMADDDLAAGRLINVGGFAVMVSSHRGGHQGGSSADSLEDLTTSELYEMAKERDIDGRSSMDKAELIAALS